MIVDAHCHIIAPAMLTPAVPLQWRPVLRSEAGRQVITFRGRTLHSVVAEFCDVDAMLAEAAADGVDHLVLSPWIMLVPVEAALDEAIRVCRVQNEALAGVAASGRVSALGAVPLQDGPAAARELAGLMKLPGLCGAEIPASVAGDYLGEDRFLPFWEAAADTGALIFVHPTTTGFRLPALAPYYLWNSAGNPLETAITAAQLATAGIMERYPRLKILLAHGGGGLHALRGQAPPRLRGPPGGPGPVRRGTRRGPAPVLLRHHYPRSGAAGRPGRVRRGRSRAARLGPAVRHGRRASGRRGHQPGAGRRRAAHPGRQRAAAAVHPRWRGPAVVRACSALIPVRNLCGSGCE